MTKQELFNTLEEMLRDGPFEEDDLGYELVRDTMAFIESLERLVTAQREALRWILETAEEGHVCQEAREALALTDAATSERKT